ncbi:MAG TPA: serine hydrolase domain-containing protein [Steroidobacteraceae bacterium]|nr:serine hydrolase domain-containing protein [Steroidobacteraceae bacterium]
MAFSTRRSFVIGAGSAAAAAAFPFFREASGQSRDAITEADSDIRTLIERERNVILATMEKEVIPGAAVCLVRDGKVVWVEGFGVTDRNSKRRVGTDTIFSIQSTSKNMTATAIMLAVQRGVLDLDKPVTAYLSDFTVSSRFESRPQDKITLRHLLNHSAGFTHDAPVGNNNYPDAPSFETHVRSIYDTWLRFPVGERLRYSNLGFDLAGLILQTVMKRPFAECLANLVFDPIGMKDTTAVTENYVRRNNRAVGHDRGYDTVPLSLPFIPSGGVYTSARDMAKYLVFHINKGRVGRSEVMREKQWDEMHTFALPGAWSLGVAGGKLRFGDTDVQMFTHNGSGVGFGSVFRFYPQAKLGWAALFTASTGGGYGWGAALTDEVLTRRYGKPTARIRVEDFSAASPPTSELQKFEGTWMGRGTNATFKIDGDALVVKRGQSEAKVKVISPIDIVLPPEGPGRNATQLRYFQGRSGAMPHLLSLLGDGHLDYNDGPNDLLGPDRSEWDGFIGDYRTERWGKLEYEIKIYRKNGYLYGNEFRFIIEHKPGLFFTSDGEAVDFRGPIATWRSIPLLKS